MLYSIRYEQDQRRYTDEIEAHSPEEAVVKFEQIKRVRPDRSLYRLRVTSVSAADGEQGWNV
ncbi:MAG: hypothetical protein HQ546_04455 [Planctomycetes bacterium]|nr:hypothetical protein [Planctomycetota bacterium]